MVWTVITCYYSYIPFTSLFLTHSLSLFPGWSVCLRLQYPGTPTPPRHCPERSLSSLYSSVKTLFSPVRWIPGWRTCFSFSSCIYKKDWCSHDALHVCKKQNGQRNEIGRNIIDFDSTFEKEPDIIFHFSPSESLPSVLLALLRSPSFTLQHRRS